MWERSTGESRGLAGKRAELVAEAVRVAERLAAFDPAESLDEWTPARVGFEAYARRVAGQIEQLDALLAGRAELDALAASRPEGCACLGLGGTGVCYELGAALVWQSFCGCPDGQAALAELGRLTAEYEAETRAIATARHGGVEPEAVDPVKAALARLDVDPVTWALSWASFEGEPGKQDAVDALRALVRGESTRGVFLTGGETGGFGVGKTTLAALSARDWIRASAEREAIGKSQRGGAVVTTVAAWLDAGRPASDGHGTRGNAHSAVAAGLLVMDDLGAERLTDWGREQLFALIEARKKRHAPVIWTSNYGLDELVARIAGDADSREGERIVARIDETCDVIEVRGVDYRARAREQRKSAAVAREKTARALEPVASNRRMRAVK